MSTNDTTDPTTHTIGAAASILGVTVRTLRRAHRILVYREAGMPLQKVKKLIDGEESEKAALIQQREILEQRAAHLHSMLTTIDDLIEAITMNTPLSPREAADKFGFEWRQDWQDEAEARWSNPDIDTDTWAEAQQRVAHFTESDWREAADAQDLIVEKLHAAVRAGIDPDSEVGREISALHRREIAKHYDCGHSRQVILARMYTQDERFREYYDGTAPQDGTALAKHRASENGTAPGELPDNEKAGDSEVFTPGATDWLLAAIEADARANGVDPDAAEWN